jgi:hypothetical protein
MIGRKLINKYWLLFLFWIPLVSCEEDIPDFDPTVNHLYGSLFKVWYKKNIVRNLQTGAVSSSESRDLDLQYIFTRDILYRSTTGGASFDELTDFHVSLDSISYSYPSEGLSQSFFVKEVFRMKNGDPRLDDITEPRDEVFPELDDFYLFLVLENKKKTLAENSEITEVIWLYSEGFAEEP